jgi:uncharacterized protein YndB with AHSA1/START domain
VSGLVVERRVSVPPEKVFTYFTEPDKWLAWQGTEADIELVPGGVWRVNVTGPLHKRLADVSEGRDPGPNAPGSSG